MIRSPEELNDSGDALRVNFLDAAKEKITAGLALVACGAAIAGCSIKSSDGEEHFKDGELVQRAVVLGDMNEQNSLDAAEQLAPGNFPFHTNPDGSWKTNSKERWTSGFFAGSLWLAYEDTPEETRLNTKGPIKDDLRIQAERWTDALESQKYNTKNHDIGFQIMTSFGNGYRITKDEHYKDVMLTAADSLASRYNREVGSIRSWGPADGKGDFHVIMDNMMNIELLFWGAKNGGNPEWADMARQHALTTMENHFRPDGSAYQLVKYDPVTGEVRQKKNFQAQSDETTFARTQAWAIAGFTIAYHETKDERFLDTARKASEYFLKNLPEDNVPYWDFQASNIPDEPRDSSAAAIVSSYLFELSKVDPDEDQRKAHFDSARKIFSSLVNGYLVGDTDNSMALLDHGSQGKKSGLFDVGLSYGDYYLAEAARHAEQAASK